MLLWGLKEISRIIIISNKCLHKHLIACQGCTIYYARLPHELDGINQVFSYAADWGDQTGPCLGADGSDQRNGKGLDALGRGKRESDGMNESLLLSPG